MHLESSIVIRRTPEQVGAFLGNVANVSKWDRGVAATRQTSEGDPGVGLEFDTLGYSKPGADEVKSGRMSYRITKADPVEGCTVELTNRDGNARFFKKASWHFRIEPAPEGCRLICSADFVLRFRYFILGPILYAKRSAIQFDLQGLKRAVEEDGLATAG